MPDNDFLKFIPYATKCVLRKTNEEVEVIDYQSTNRGGRSEDDWVTYIDSKGDEHLKEPLTFNLDFKRQDNVIFDKLLDIAKGKMSPSIRNCRIFELAKELMLQGKDKYDAIEEAMEFVDAIGITND